MKQSLQSHRISMLILALVAIGAITIWGWRLAGSRGFNEQTFKQLDGIEVSVTQTTRVNGSYQLTCRVHNHTGKIAEQIVLNARIHNEHGKVLAANPLIQLSDLPGGTDRLIHARVPATGSVSAVTGDVQVTLVKWRD